MIKGYIGSYASKKSKHVIQFLFDEEKKQFINCMQILPWEDTKYMSLKGNDLISVSKEQKAGILWLHKDNGSIEKLFLEQGTSCYVDQDENFIYTANYHEGTVMIYAKQNEFHLHKRILIQEKAGCHQVILQDHYLLVPCLLLDKVMVFDKDMDFAFVRDITFPKGSGPRHGIFDHQGRFFIVSELSNQLFVFDVKDLNFTLCDTMDLLEDTTRNAAAAAIRMSKDERFLYISMRDVNQIVVVDVEKKTIQQRISSKGDHPRDIQLSSDDAFLFVANRFTDNVVVFERDASQGTLTACDTQINAPEGVSIVLETQEAEL